MDAEILSVGTELLLGNTVNTDARDLSELLSELGVNVYYHSVVGDNPERLKSAVNIAKGRADLIITTGGLGPTCDDLTKQVLAEAFGLELYFDEAEAARIRGYFADRLGAKMTPNNLQQAMLPAGCTVFRNEWGTAPGGAFEAEGKTVIMLPGPPSECAAMFQNCAMPYLREKSKDVIVSHSLRIFGMGESAVEDKLRDLMNALTNPTLAPYAKEGEVMLRVTAKAKSRAEAEALLAPVVAQVQDALGDLIYGIDVESLEACVSALLRERGMTLALAESCTGGLLAKRLTDLPGASDILRGGVVVYSVESKTLLLGIEPALIEKKGAVSPEVAELMAKNVREKLRADIGIGITGNAGPTGDGRRPVGDVFIAMATQEGCEVAERRQGNGRARVRTAAANQALDMVRRYLTEG
ncbi:MAG: competence/damage-inducible protein A [Firmicutes bacterium]|nr:competence/damage-inducible protein A [Bacillota bacterium]